MAALEPLQKGQGKLNTSARWMDVRLRIPGNGVELD